MEITHKYGKDILRSVTKEESKYLLQIYKEQIKFGKFYYFYILTQLKWMENVQKNNFHLNVSTNLYTHCNGNLENNATVICILQDNITKILLCTLEPSFKELSECLLYTKRIDWKSGPIFLGVTINLTVLLKEIELTKKLIQNQETTRSVYCFILECENAKKIENNNFLPHGYQLQHLNKCHAKCIYSVWPIKSESTVGFVEDLISFNGGLGIFREYDKKLVAWVIKNEFSGIGLLQTNNDEQRKGFGKYLTIEMSKMIAITDNIDVIAFTISTNTKSQKLFQKLGFKRLENSKWIQYENSYKNASKL